MDRDNSLDRFFFKLMRKKAAATAAREGTGAERRLAPRVELDASDGLSLSVLPAAPAGVLGRANRTEETGPTFQVSDISTTGGCFIAQDLEDLELATGETIRIRLQGEELDIELKAKVVYSQVI